MSKLDTIDLKQPFDLRHLADALSDFNGYVPVIDRRASAVSKPHWILRDGPWQSYQNVEPVDVGPLGASFRRDVTLCGSGYIFLENRFLKENTHTSEIALQWLENADFPDNPLTHPLVNDIEIIEPVLIVFGPGYPIYGHWLLDYLPRIVIAQRVLGEHFSSFVIPLPEDVPEWLFSLLRFFCGVERSQIRLYNRSTDRLLCRKACLPDFGHDGNYALHPFVTDFYSSFKPDSINALKRRICVSRLQVENDTRSKWRVFESRDLFEKMAVARGYEIVYPENLDFKEQIAVFSEADIIVGEFGSAVHNAIFSGSDVRIGCFPLNNSIQTQIGNARGHHNIYVDRYRQTIDDRGVVFFDLAEADLVSMFDFLENMPR